MEKSIEERLQNGVHGYIDAILYENRFFVQHPFMEKVKRHIALAEKGDGAFKVLPIEKGKKLYRARICDDDFMRRDYNFTRINHVNYLYSKGKYVEKATDTLHLEPRIDPFFGYNELGSSVPDNSNIIKDGRANPLYIKYLYAASDEQTALAEVRPLIDSVVSIATIEVEEPLRILSLFYGFTSNDETNEVIQGLHNIFSTPCSGDPKDYLPAQYVSEYIKSLGNQYDGIGYYSSQNRTGQNFAIFNYQKCKPVSSKLYQVGKIRYTATCVSPIADSSELVAE